MKSFSGLVPDVVIVVKHLAVDGLAIREKSAAHLVSDGGVAPRHQTESTDDGSLEERTEDVRYDEPVVFFRRRRRQVQLD